MSNVQFSVPEYICPPRDDVWVWNDAESFGWVTADPDVTKTITFTTHVENVLRQLHHQHNGLPPLTLVLAILDACTESWNGEVSKRSLLKLSQRLRGTALSSMGIPDSESIVNEIAMWLARIHWIPKKLRSRIDIQVAIISLVMADAPAVLYEVTDLVEIENVLSCLAIAPHQRPIGWLDAVAPSMGTVRAKQVLSAFRYAIGRPITEQSINLWLDAHVVDVPEPAEIDPPAHRISVGDAIRNLATDETWGGVAKSAMQATNVLTLPRRPSDPEELPLGGVSDITNRGNPERLLMRELAQEPMVMLARIANGQALYLRREVPPGPSPPVRPVFLESGIRTWGNRRLKIAAVAMAIAAAEERRGESNALLYTVHGDERVSESFVTRDGIIEHLSRLHADEHPGAAIADWFSESDMSKEPFADPIVVVTAATDSDPRFRRSLDEVQGAFLVIRIERDDTATLLKRTRLGDEVLQSFSLGAPKEPERQVPKNVLRVDSSTSPLFFDAGSLLRFASDINHGSWFEPTEHGLYTISCDKRLLLFDQDNQGAIEILSRVPDSNVLAVEKNAKSISLIVGQPFNHHLIQVENGRANVIELKNGRDRNSDYAFDQGSIFRFGRHIELIDPSSGKILDRIESELPFIGAAVAAAGPYLKLYSNQAGHIAEHDFKIRNVDQPSFLFAIRDGNEKIVALTRDLSQMVRLGGDKPEIHRLGKRSEQLYARNPTLLYQSADRNSIVIDAYEKKQRCLELATNSMQICTAGRHVGLLKYDHSLRMRSQPINLLKRIASIRFDNGDIVFLKGQKKWTLNFLPACSQYNLQLHPDRGRLPSEHLFSQTLRPETSWGSAKWKLRPIEIANHRVTIDSRGLLHLRRGDNGTEVTLAMYIDCVCGWTSWGERFGSEYGIGKITPVSPTIRDWLTEFSRLCEAV